VSGHSHRYADQDEQDGIAVKRANGRDAGQRSSSFGSGRPSGTRLHAVTPRVVLMLVRAEGSSRPDFAR